MQEQIRGTLHCWLRSALAAMSAAAIELFPFIAAQCNAVQPCHRTGHTLDGNEGRSLQCSRKVCVRASKDM
eukprot:1818396-Rhodomonas_salina.7